MKLTISMLCTAFILLSSFSFQKIATEEIIITGLRFDKDRTAAMRKIAKQPAFIIDNKGVVRAGKTHQIIYVKADKALVILPKSTSYSTFKITGGFDVIELPDGTLVGCLCDSAKSTCRFDNSNKEFEFVCTGSCGCYIGVLFEFTSPPLEYETAGGQWFNF